MFRLWGKIFYDNRLQKDLVIADDSTASRTKKVFDSIEKICYEFDLGQPIWLESNIKDFQRLDKVRFYQDNFVEQISFDYLEIQIIEED